MLVVTYGRHGGSRRPQQNEAHYKLWLEIGSKVTLLIIRVSHYTFVIYGDQRQWLLSVQYQADAQ